MSLKKILKDLISFNTINDKENQKIIQKIKDLINNTESNLEIINSVNPFSNSNEKINISDFITEASFIEVKNRYILGVGPINAHKKDEFITIESLNKLEGQYIEIIKRKNSRHRGSAERAEISNVPLLLNFTLKCGII